MKSDIKIVNVQCSFNEEALRIPLKFGDGIVRTVTSCTVEIEVENGSGARARGFGNILLSDLWAFPDPSLTHEIKDKIMREISSGFGKVIENYPYRGHPLDIYMDLEEPLFKLAAEIGEKEGIQSKIPALVPIVCASPFDTALHDAFGKVNAICSYEGYSKEFMACDLSKYLGDRFKGQYISDFLLPHYSLSMPVFHLVGGTDPLTVYEKNYLSPQDGVPVSLDEWIKRDGVYCFKIKLSGRDIQADVDRTMTVAKVVSEQLKQLGTSDYYFSTDSNEMNESPDTVIEYLNKLKEASPEAYHSVLYLEQPIERDLSLNRFDMSRVAELKPIFADEGIVDIETFELARALGWSGVAMKICKGISHALLYLAMAKTYGIRYSVQDLTNPGIAFIQSAGFAARIQPVMGVEYNSRQYIPFANTEWSHHYQDLFQVRHGKVSFNNFQQKGLF